MSTHVELKSLIRKYKMSQKMLILDKPCGFFCLAISDEEKSFMASTQSRKLISPHNFQSHVLKRGLNTKGPGVVSAKLLKTFLQSFLGCLKGTTGLYYKNILTIISGDRKGRLYYKCSLGA
jgi:hypothetical protein